jgi:hypothetical protein
MRLRKTAKITYKPDATGQMQAVTSYCRPITLHNYVADITDLATKYSKLTSQQLLDLRRDLDSFGASLGRKYGLKKPPPQKMFFTRPTPGSWFKKEMKDPISIDVSLQFCNIIRLISQVGSRPCGLFITKAYDNFFQLGDLKFYRVKDERGRTLGFSMDWILKSFKGFQKDIAHEMPVCLASLQNRRFLYLDAPTGIVAQLFRRGCFGEQTAAEVYDDPGSIVTIDPAFIQQPFYLKINKKGEGLVSTENVNKWKELALRAVAVNQMLSR